VGENNVNNGSAVTMSNCTKNAIQIYGGECDYSNK